MAQAGDHYTIQLKPSHLRWGIVRNTHTRRRIRGEAYIPLPLHYARLYNIFNSKNSSTGFGYNLFHASSTDGFLNDVTLLAQGNKKKGDIYAKQLSVQ